MLQQTWTVPSGVNHWTVFATVKDSRSDSRVRALQYRCVDDSEPNGDALVVLPSGRIVQIREYSKTVGSDVFSLMRSVGDGDTASLLQEFLREAGLEAEDVTWVE